MKHAITAAITILAALAFGCATFHQPSQPAGNPAATVMGAGGSGVALDAPPTEPTDPEQRTVLTLQDRLNVFASPGYLSDVQAAKAAGADALQVQCMDSTVAFGADIKAKPLFTLQSVDIGPVDRSCGWCRLAEKRKADAERRNGPSILVRLAEGRKRLGTLARTTLVACAPLTRDIELSAMNPENIADALLRLIDLIGGR